MRGISRLIAGLVGLAFFSMAGSANATLIELVTNGGFETGDFTGWTNTGAGSGFGFTINDGTFNPAGPSVPNAPISGNFDAVSSQTGPGSNTIVQQSLLLPSSFTSLTFSWSDRIENFAGVFSDPNQEFRVQLLDSLNNIIATVFSTNPGDPLIQLGPNNRLFDVTAVLLAFAGQFIGLNFVQQDNLNFFNVTVDNVSFIAMTTVPEPTTLALFAFGLAGLGFMMRRRRLMYLKAA